MVPLSIRLERTAVDRFLRRPAPRVVLDRDIGYLSASAPLPQAYQSGLSAEFFTQLDQYGGQFPLGPFFTRYMRALRAGVVDADEVPGLDWTPPPTNPAVPVLAIANSARHTNFSLEIQDGIDTPLVPSDRWRTYLLLVNQGANPATIGLDKGGVGGLPLASGGGFLELTFGTQSSVRAVAVGGATTIHVVVGRSHPAKACALDCPITS